MWIDDLSARKRLHSNFLSIAFSVAAEDEDSTLTDMSLGALASAAPSNENGETVTAAGSLIRAVWGLARVRQPNRPHQVGRRWTWNPTFKGFHVEHEAYMFVPAITRGRDMAASDALGCSTFLHESLPNIPLPRYGSGQAVVCVLKLVTTDKYATNWVSVFSARGV